MRTTHFRSLVKTNLPWLVKREPPAIEAKPYFDDLVNKEH